MVTTLHLARNRICAEGAIAIAEALKVNVVVTTLNLGGNNIGDEGAIAIAEALKVTAVLTNLDLSRNEIGDEGTKVITDSLKSGMAVLTTPSTSSSTPSGTRVPRRSRRC